MKEDNPYEKVYIKTGKDKYVPVDTKSFEGFPSDGIFIVQRNIHSHGYCRIAKLEELDNIHIPTLAALNIRRDAGIKAVLEALRSPCSPQGIFDAVIKAVSKSDISPEEEATRKFENAIG
jgi:hypothetical protein